MKLETFIALAFAIITTPDEYGWISYLAVALIIEVGKEDK